MSNDIGTVSPKYQIGIPKSVRDEVQIKPGQKFAFLSSMEHQTGPVRPSRTSLDFWRCQHRGHT